MKLNRQHKRTRRPKQLPLAAVHPSSLFAQWREALGLHLLAEHGRSARLARRLQVSKCNVADWFTVRRNDPPGWVVLTLSHEAAQYNLPNVEQLIASEVGHE
jgi:AraC-like DNA-binding protein